MGSSSKTASAPARRVIGTSGIASLIHSEEDCCGSQSASATPWPCAWSQPASDPASVDFPTPPLELTIATIMTTAYDALAHLASKICSHPRGQQACMLAC